MRVRDALAGTPLPRADAEVLLAHVLGKDRAWLLGHDGDDLSPEAWAAYSALVARRRRHEPVSQITGWVEFYGRAFRVTRDVLTPRPSTEGVVRGALSFLRGDRDGAEDVDEGIVVVRRGLRDIGPVGTVVDVGTGSGCVAATLALERPDLRVIATDVSESALRVAAGNAEALGARVEFRLGSCLEPLADLAEPFLVVGNPPYIKDGAVLMRDVSEYEPAVALFGGPDGGDVVRAIVAGAERNDRCAGLVIECLAEHEALVRAG